MKATSAGMLPLLIAVAGCSSVIIQPERVERIRTVVLAGLTIEVESSYEESGESYDPDSGTWRATDKIKLSNRDLAKHNDVEKIQSALLKSLESGLKWTILPSDRLAASGEYADLLRFQLGRTWAPPDYRNITPYGLPGHLHFYQVTELTPENRARILDQTGADGMIAVRVVLRIEKTDAFSISNLLGVGAFYPTAVTELVAYDRQDEDPIWHERGAESNPDVEGTFQIGGEGSDEVLMEKAMVAVQSSFKRLIKRYRENF